MSEMIERFWQKVAIRRSDECWPWVATTTKNGTGQVYGQFRLNRKMIRAHRLAYEINNGPIPCGLVVRHSCDNTLCCNPKHLEIGTQKQNVQDRYDRGRDFHHRGEGHARSKLTKAQVHRIRLRVAQGESQRKLAAEYGVSQFGIRYAIKGWRHV